MLRSAGAVAVFVLVLLRVLLECLRQVLSDGRRGVEGLSEQGLGALGTAQLLLENFQTLMGLLELLGKSQVRVKHLGEGVVVLRWVERIHEQGLTLRLDSVHLRHKRRVLLLCLFL